MSRMEVWRCVKELESWKWADESDGSVEECGSVAKSAASSLSSKTQKTSVSCSRLASTALVHHCLAQKGDGWSLRWLCRVPSPSATNCVKCPPASFLRASDFPVTLSVYRNAHWPLSQSCSSAGRL